MTAETNTQDKPTGFRQKVVASTKLSGIKFLSEVGLRLVSTIVLTRLLAPETYGVFAIVLLYMYILEMLSDVGLRSLVITREGEIEDGFLQTCWTVSILRGFFIFCLSLVIASTIFVLQGQQIFPADNPYAAEALPWAIAALGGVTFILGFASPVIFLRERNMEFGRLIVVQIVINVVSLIVTITCAYYLRSIWALVLGQLVRCTLQVVLSFLLFRGVPMRLNLNRNDLAVVIDRGKWILGHSVLHALSQSGDRLFLGFAMTSTTFGFYFIARQIIEMVTQFLNSINGQMGLQVFTYLQKSSADAFRSNYYRYRFFFDAMAGLSAGGLIVLAPRLVEVIFDDRYQGVAPIIQVLIWSVLLIGPTLLRSAFSAERRFREMTFLSLVTAATLWIGLSVATLVFDSVPAALTVIALHRLPEAMIITLMGGDRDWVVIWREFISFAFCGVGIVLGLGVLALWSALL